MTQYQDLEWVVTRCEHEFANNKNRRISALFRDLRRNKNYSLLGDYFLFWAIAQALKNKNIKRSRANFSYALMQSDEYKALQKRDKVAWISTFMEMASGEMKNISHASKRGERPEKV